MTDDTMQETRMRFLFLCFCHRQSYSLFRDTRRGFLFVCDCRAGANRRNRFFSGFLQKKSHEEKVKGMKYG